MSESDVTISGARLFFGYATGTNLMFPFAVGGNHDGAPRLSGGLDAIPLRAAGRENERILVNAARLCFLSTAGDALDDFRSTE